MPPLAASPFPIDHDTTLQQLFEDPYPVYERLRRRAAVVHVPAANMNLITRFDDISLAERNTDIFASSDDTSLMRRVMGPTLMRKDGDAHRSERAVLEPVFRPGVVGQHWAPLFGRIADELIDAMEAKGSADLFQDFAAPMAARSLMAVLGLPQVRWQDMCVWSQTMMDGCANYGDDPEVWSRCKATVAAIEAAIRERLPQLGAAPDLSVLSAYANAETHIPFEQIAGNVKVIIGGGLNEPRDAICSTVYALLRHPEQLARVRAEPALYKTAFEEAVRWIAPIGLYPRRLVADFELSDTLVPAGTRVALCIASACRDETHFPNPASFDIGRENRRHLAFGAGPHFCMGTWLARKQVGEIATPKLFERLPGLRLDPERAARFGGWVFRGALELPVLWDAAPHQNGNRD
jgi:cytochrome P450